MPVLSQNHCGTSGPLPLFKEKENKDRKRRMSFLEVALKHGYQRPPAYVLLFEKR